MESLLDMYQAPYIISEYQENIGKTVWKKFEQLDWMLFKSILNGVFMKRSIENTIFKVIKNRSCIFFLYTGLKKPITYFISPWQFSRPAWRHSVYQNGSKIRFVGFIKAWTIYWCWEGYGWITLMVIGKTSWYETKDFRSTVGYFLHVLN